MFNKYKIFWVFINFTNITMCRWNGGDDCCLHVSGPIFYFFKRIIYLKKKRTLFSQKFHHTHLFLLLNAVYGWKVILKNPKVSKVAKKWIMCASNSFLKSICDLTSVRSSSVAILKVNFSGNFFSKMYLLWLKIYLFFMRKQQLATLILTVNQK